MLRPSKIFVSLHQLRHYFNTRITELAVSHQPNQLAQQLKHGSTTQQMMTLFSSIQKSVVRAKAPIPAISNEKYLLQKINQHFPVTKAFSSPSLHQRVWVTANLQPCTHMGFHRPSTALGLGRTFGAARQYSTSPFAPVFRHNVATPTNNVFAHISSRMFTPATSKFNQVDSHEKTSVNQATPMARKMSQVVKPNGAKVFVSEPALTPIVVSSDISIDDSIDISKLDSIIRHDDLHNEINPRVHTSSLTTNNQLPTTARSVYLLISMDATQFWNSKTRKKRWTTERLSSSFVDSIEQMAYEYQVHIDSVLKLLDRLERHGKFRTVTGQDELRIYFPPSVQSKEEALMVLEAFNIMFQKQPCFTIEIEDCEFDTDIAVEQEPASTDSSIGSDYFKDLQLFLDHTDYLIEASPVFNQR